jgi:hypothetical protein
MLRGTLIPFSRRRRGVKPYYFVVPLSCGRGLGVRALQAKLKQRSLRLTWKNYTSETIANGLKLWLIC